MLQKVNTMPEVTEDWFQFDDEEEEGSDNQESQDFEEEAHAKLLADVQGITKKSRWANQYFWILSSGAFSYIVLFP